MSEGKYTKEEGYLIKYLNSFLFLW